MAGYGLKSFLIAQSLNQIEKAYGPNNSSSTTAMSASASPPTTSAQIAEAAIASFLSPDAAERREAAIGKRLDQFDRRMTRLERDMGTTVESLAVFIRFWLHDHTSAA